MAAGMISAVPASALTIANRQRLNEQRRYAVISSRFSALLPMRRKLETVSLPVAESTMPYANLYIWREKRKGCPTSMRFAVSVFQDGSKVLEVAPIHCAGYRKRQLEQYVQKEVMSYLIR